MLTLDANIWVAAFDPRDRFHAQSAAFLLAVAQRRLPLTVPAFALVEVACALARRAQSAGVGQTAQQRLRTHPLLTLHPMNENVIATATQLGVQKLLRGADSLYAATSVILNTELVSWDDDLILRAGAVTPAGWLAANP